MIHVHKLIRDKGRGKEKKNIFTVRRDKIYTVQLGKKIWKEITVINCKKMGISTFRPQFARLSTSEGFLILNLILFLILILIHPNPNLNPNPNPNTLLLILILILILTYDEM